MVPVNKERDFEISLDTSIYDDGRNCMVAKSKGIKGKSNDRLIEHMIILNVDEVLTKEEI